MDKLTTLFENCKLIGLSAQIDSNKVQVCFNNGGCCLIERYGDGFSYPIFTGAISEDDELNIFNALELTATSSRLQ